MGEHSFKQLSQDWENLDKERTLHTNDNSLSSKNFDYETGLKDRDPLAVEIKRICDELGPDLMAKLVRAPIPVLPAVKFKSACFFICSKIPARYEKVGTSRKS